ncbi:MAG: hypothetical protein ABSC76_16635 [Terracidiphilus sp.]|jgi:hypothetical protein
MSSHTNVLKSTGESAVGTLNAARIRFATAIQVVSVGPVERGCWVHDALSGRPNARLTIATDLRQLWSISTQQSIQVAILHDTLSLLDFEAASRLIRRRFPSAKILVVSREESFLEDALYDDRVAPTVAPTVLLRAIERVAYGSVQTPGPSKPSSCLAGNASQA